VLEGEKSPPLFISYHPEGPISLFERTPRGEIAIRLSSKERYHAQFIYQFAHELAHVRAKFQPAEHENKWLEETLCEAASLYALRELSRRWGQEAPSLSLKKYRLHLASYADKVLGTRRNLSRESASDFYSRSLSCLTSRPIHSTGPASLTSLAKKGKASVSISTHGKKPSQKNITPFPRTFVACSSRLPERGVSF